MKFRILGMLLLANFIYASSFAQPVIQTQKVFGGSNVDGGSRVSLAVTNGYGLIIGGSSYSNKSGEKTQNIRGSDDYWLLKLKQNGKIEWDKTIGGILDDNFKSVIQTSDGGYALIGESNSYTSVEKDEDSRGSTDYWIVKLDRKGAVEWNKTIGGGGNEYIDNIVQTSDGGYILAGSSDSYQSGEKSEDSRGYFDYWVVKLDKNGAIQWNKTIGGNSYEFLSGVELTSDGGVVLAGFSQSYISGEKTENSRGNYDFWLVKLTKEGQVQWDKTIGGDGEDYGRGIKQTKEGGYVFSGISNSNISGEKTEDNRGFFDYWVVKLDKMGNVIRDKTIGGNGNDTEVWCLEKVSDGGYIFGGSSNSNTSGEKTEDSRGDYDYWVIKLDENLNIQWDKTIGGNSYDALFNLKEIQQDQFVLSGSSWSDISGDKTEPTRGAADYWVVWLNSAEKPVWYRDGDGDGWGNTQDSVIAQDQPKGYVSRKGDCNDNDKDIHPHGPALCDGKDNDCDGLIDEHCSDIQIIAAPNPSTGHFTIQIKSTSAKPIHLQIINELGKVMEVRNSVAPNATLTFGHNYRAGIYYAEAVQEEKRTSIKVMKQAH